MVFAVDNDRIRNYHRRHDCLRRQRGRVVRLPDLKSVALGFKSRSDH